MSTDAVAVLGFIALFALMLLRVPIAMAMGFVGFVGVGLTRSWPAAISTTASEFVDVAAYTLSVVPLFVLMGNFVTKAGMSRELYRASYSFLGHLRGGREMDVSVGKIHRRAVGFARAAEGVPLGSAEDLVDQHGDLMPRARPAVNGRDVSPCRHV